MRIKPLCRFMLILIFLGSFNVVSHAQSTPDSTHSPKKKSMKLWKNMNKGIKKAGQKIVYTWYGFKNTRSTIKAPIYSIIPGLGQAYNRSYWKIPIAVGLVGGFGYLAYSKRAIYLQYKNEGNDIESDRARTDMERFFIYAVLGYLVQIMDATVDAHLKTFDVSDNLTLNVSPTILKPENENSYKLYRPGISLSLTLN